MGKTVNMHEAKTHLSRLAERASGGEEIIIARAGRPVAKLVPIGDGPVPRRLGLWKGKVSIGDDFDAPLPEDFQEQFDGRAG
jgi:prevent-host-death family protein